MSITINIFTIPHGDQRYSTCGDWRVQGLDSASRFHQYFRIDVSELKDWRFEALVAIHEMVEMLLCRHRGISEEEVTAWDKQFEEDRAADRKMMIERLDELKTRRGEGPRDEHEESDLEADLAEMPAEPGEHPGAPYHDEHMFATRIEEMLAKQLGVDWAEYERAIEAL